MIIIKDMIMQSGMPQTKQIQISVHQRDYSLNVIKIPSCVLVVLMHSRRTFDKSVELILYFTILQGKCAKPGSQRILSSR